MEASFCTGTGESSGWGLGRSVKRAACERGLSSVPSVQHPPAGWFPREQGHHTEKPGQDLTASKQLEQQRHRWPSSKAGHCPGRSAGGQDFNISSKDTDIPLQICAF